MMFFFMRQYLLILLFIFFPLSVFEVKVDYRLSAGAGMIMPDGKVDVIVDDKNAWVGPVYNADFSATFYPAWQAMQDWRGAGVGVGLSYWNFGHSMLGHALAPYVYMDIPFVQLPHFRLGIRPAIGVGFLTKTYANTVPEDQKYLSLEHSNRSVGSVTNCYFPEMLYLDFPITNGWSVGLSGGWYHFSNGSLRQPNSGYNIFAAEMAVRYQPNTKESLKTVDATEKVPNNSKRWSIALAATATGRQVYYCDQQTFFVSSMHAAAYWHAHPIFRLGGGVDVFYDGAYVKRETKFQKTNLAAAQPGDCWRVGVSVQPEFIAGNFTAGLHIGAYLYDPVKELEPYQDAIQTPTGRLDKPIFYAYDLLKAGSAGYPDGWLYTELVLRYHLPWNIFIQGMMKSHLTKVEFISLGIGFYY